MNDGLKVFRDENVTLLSVQIKRNKIYFHPYKKKNKICKDYMDVLFNRVQKVRDEAWQNKSILKPHASFLSQLEKGTRHKFDLPAIPEHVNSRKRNYD